MNRAKRLAQDFSARQGGPDSVLLPRSLGLQEALKLEAGSHHPTILAVAPKRSLVMDIIPGMVGKDQPFSEIFPVNDVTPAIWTLIDARKRGERIGVVIIDTATGVEDGYQHWTDLAKAMQDEHLGNLVLFGEVTWRERLQYRKVISRVIEKPKTS